VHHRLGIVVECRLKGLRVADVALNQLKTLVAQSAREVGSLDIRIVVRLEVVEADDPVATGQQRFGHVRAYETSRSGDQDGSFGHLGPPRR